MLAQLKKLIVSGFCGMCIFMIKKRHPKNMGSREVEHFLSHLATNEKVAAST